VACSCQLVSRKNAEAAYDLTYSLGGEDGDLILVRELDERRGFSELIQQHWTDSRGKITQFPLVDLLRQRLVKTGRRLLKHVRYYLLLLAEGHVTRRLFGSMLRMIAALPLPNE